MVNCQWLIGNGKNYNQNHTIDNQPLKTDNC